MAHKINVAKMMHGLSMRLNPTFGIQRNPNVGLRRAQSLVQTLIIDSLRV
jgi:hypothetical protein